MTAPSAQYLNLPFSEAIRFFRDKVNLPTKKWDDLWSGMHSRAFVVAGATKAELLADLREAVCKAISQGTTLADFRKDFDQLVEKHGWQYKGGRDWRTAVIFDTNLSTAYSAGHYAGRTAPAVLAVRPWWKYMPSSSANPNREHMRWYGIVLRYDDPWWRTHTPPNDWGCKCGVTTMSNAQYQRTKDKLRTEAPDDGTYEYVDKKTGVVSQVPVGIGPGWDYSPGRAAWGEKLSDRVMKEYQAMKADAWENLTPGDWQTHGLAERLVPVKPQAALGPKLTTRDAAVAGLANILGGPEKVFSLETKDFRHDLLVNAETLIDHLELARTPYLPFIPEAMTDPDELWLRFDRHKGTGQVVLRTRLIKAIDLGGKKGLLAVFNGRNGMLEAWTMMPIDKASYVNRQRSGKLIYAKGKKEVDGQDAAASPALYGN